MSTQRITISLPSYLYQHLTELVGERFVSKFAAQAIERQILEEKRKEDPVQQILKLKKSLPQYSHDEVLDSLHEGRK